MRIRALGSRLFDREGSAGCGESDFYPLGLSGSGLAYAFHTLSGSIATGDITTMTFDAYAPVGSYNSGVWLGEYAAGNGISLTTNNSADGYPSGWQLIVGQDEIPADDIFIPGGLDIPVSFEIVIDVPDQEMYLTYDLGNGPQSTSVFSGVTWLNQLDTVSIEGDYRYGYPQPQIGDKSAEFVQYRYFSRSIVLLRFTDMLKPCQQSGWQFRLYFRRNQTSGIHAADVDPVLVTKRAQLHPHQVRNRDHHYFPAVNSLLLRRNRRIRRGLIGSHHLPAEDQMNRILRTVGVSVQQHVDARRMAESEAVARGGFFNLFEILAPDHKVHVSCQRGEFRVGLLDVDEDRKAANHFIRHAFLREDLGDFVQYANEIEQPFFKQRIDRFPARRCGAQKLLKGEKAH